MRGCRSIAGAAVIALLIFLVHAPSVALADECPQPVYRGLKHGGVLRFLGETGATVYSERGTIETRKPRRIFKFETTHSNGFSREYLLVKDAALGDAVDSLVVRKKSDFTDADGPAPFILTPDLEVKYYYATNQEGQEALHAIKLDDTWKLVGCGGAPSKRG